MLKAFLAVVAFLLGVAVAFTIVSLALWWLVPLAFPLLPFGFYNAMALTVILLLIGLPATIKN